MNHKQAVQAVAWILAVIGGGTFFIIGLASKADDFNTTVPPAELWPVSIASYTGLLLIYIAAIVYGQIALISSDEFPAVTKFCGRYDVRSCLNIFNEILMRYISSGITTVCHGCSVLVTLSSKLNKILFGYLDLDFLFFKDNENK